MPSLRRAHVALGVLVVAAVAVRIPLLGGPEIDYDEGVYWESLRAMSAGHPLFSQVYSSQPPGFLAAVYPFYLLGHSLVAARAGMLVFFAIALGATYVATRALIGERAALLAALLLAIDPLALRQSLALQADGPAMALGVVAVALALQRARAGTRLDAALPMLSGAALALAVQVKLLAVVFAVPVILGLYSRRRLLAGAAGAVAAGAVVLLPFATRLDLVWQQAVAGHVSARALNEGGWTADMRAMLLRETLLGVTGIAGAVVLAMRRAGRVLLVLGAGLAAVVALAAVQHPLWPHHLVVAVPLLAIAGGALATVAVPRLVSAALAAGATVGMLAVAEGALHDPATADTVREAVAVLRHVAPAGIPIITDDQFSAAQADLDTPPELVDTSVVRLDSQPVTAGDVEAVAVRDGVRVVCLGTNRLVHLDGFAAWLQQHATRRIDVTAAASVYLLAAP